MKFVAVTIALSILAAGNAAAEMPDCISNGVTLADLSLNRTDGQRLFYSAQIINNSPAIIGGIYFGGTIRHIDRPAPLGDFRIDERRIPGGMLPGERITVEGWTFVGERAVSMISDPQQVLLEPVLDGVADADLRPYDPSGKTLGGWSTDAAPSPCR